MVSPIKKILPNILIPAESLYISPIDRRVKPVEDVLSPKEHKAQAERDAQTHLANMKNDWITLNKLLKGHSRT